MIREEAIRKLKAWDFLDNDEKEVLETLIPELKESEDEKIRKWIIDDIKYNMNNETLESSEYKKQGEKAIAWLEKQSKQKPVNKAVPKFRVGDTMRTLQEANDGYTDGMPVVVSIDNEYYHCTNELIAIKDQDDYEFPPINVKQKPIDKVDEWAKLVDEVKPKWTEEDNDMLDTIESWLDTLCEYLEDSSSECIPNVKFCINWLKSLKQRIGG